ncbi:MAG: hypothetical protein QY322_02630 [bacterium]|nr:MAG: hypothetical protein QY322_02630 [bacterium]
MEREPGYQVIVYTRILPDGFKGPTFLRKIMSYLSEGKNESIGNSWPGMDIEEAKRLAGTRTISSYTDGRGQLRSSKGVVVRVS